MAFRVGDRIKNRTVDMIVERRLEGGYSIVYTGRDRLQPKDKNKIALKTLKDELLGRPEVLQLFV